MAFLTIFYRVLDFFNLQKDTTEQAKAEDDEAAAKQAEADEAAGDELVARLAAAQLDEDQKQSIYWAKINLYVLMLEVYVEKCHTESVFPVEQGEELFSKLFRYLFPVTANQTLFHRVKEVKQLYENRRKDLLERWREHIEDLKSSEDWVTSSKKKYIPNIKDLKFLTEDLVYPLLYDLDYYYLKVIYQEAEKEEESSL